MQFLDKFDTPVTHARCRVFFKVVDVPVVLYSGVPQVQSVSLSLDLVSCAVCSMCPLLGLASVQ